MKIVINTSHGGFGLSKQALEELIKHGVPVHKNTPDNVDEFYISDLSKSSHDITTLKGHSYYINADKHRTHFLLVQVVESLGVHANGRFANLKVIDIPSDVEYTIEEYDGMESIHEKHRTWF
jgi:hypothetical protein